LQFVKRNAPRWIRALTSHGFLPSAAATREDARYGQPQLRGAVSISPGASVMVTWACSEAGHPSEPKPAIVRFEARQVALSLRVGG